MGWPVFAMADGLLSQEGVSVMYSTIRLALVSACLLLSGCAGKPTVLDQHKLQSLSLYDEDNHARFTVYVSCESADKLSDAICLRTKFAFGQWAGDRDINMATVDTSNVMFVRDQLEGWRMPALADNKPYVMAIYFNPQVTPSFGAILAGGSAIPIATTAKSAKIGYTASIRIFDATNGRLVKKLSSHEFLSVKPQTDGAPYIGTVVADLVASLDPSYDPDRPVALRR
jgi:hypothetical protein